MSGPEPHSEFLQTRRFQSLDGLRALAAVVVVWHHAYQKPAAILERGLGVTLFFALSGFLITALLLRERERTGTLSLGSFYRRRALRIFPLYYAVLAFYVIQVLVLWRGRPFATQFFHDLPYYLTFTSNWFIDYPPGGWVILFFAASLATQQQFYVAWPLVMRSARSWRVPVVVATALLVAGEVSRWGVEAGVLAIGDTKVRVLVNIASPICIGCLAAYLLHAPRGFGLMQRLAGGAWSVPLALGLIALPLLHENTPRLFTAMAMVYLVVACVVRPRHLLSPVLEHATARYVGRISYGIYLLHLMIQWFILKFVPGMDGARLFVIVFPATVLAASASYRFLERPFLLIKEGLAPGGPKVVLPQAT